MAFPLGQFLNVRRSERPRLTWLYAMLLASILGVVWGEAVIEAGFLRNVGVQYLPLAIACTALVSMGSITIYNTFADRIDNHRLLVAILALCILGIGASVLLLFSGQVLIAFPLLYVIDSVVFRDLLNIHWPIYVNGFFDTQSAKRIFPVLSSATRVAAIVAGLTMPVLNRALSPTAIIFIMLLMQIVMMALVVLMRYRMGDSPTPAALPRPRPESHGAVANIQEGYRFVAGSSYLRWIALATFLMMVLLAFLNYESGRLLLANLKTVQNISNFTGLLSALGNLVALPLQLFVLSRLIGRTGVGNATLIYPSTSFLAVMGLALSPSLLTAGFGYLARTVARTTFYNPVDSLLYNAVPLRIKARARGFISGYMVATGSLAGGLLLMLENKQAAVPVLAVLFGVLAVVYLVSAFQVRRQYGNAVVAMLEQDDYASLLTPAEFGAAAVDDATLDRLAAKMDEPGPRPEMKVFTAQVLCQAGGTRAVPLLDAAVRQAGDGRLRARLVEVLAASISEPAAAEKTFTACLDDPEKEVRQAALAGLERSAGDHPARFRALAAPLLADRELQVRAAALSALVNHHSFYAYPEADLVLDTLLASNIPDQHALGIRILGRLAEDGEHPVGDALIAPLLASLRDPSDELRLAATLALEDATGISGSLPKWLPLYPLCQLLSDPVERVRHTAATLLAKSDQPEAQAMLIEALSDASPQVRSAAAEGLVQAGPGVVHLVRPLMKSAAPQLRAMSAAILARVDPDQFDATILAGIITEALRAAYDCWGYLAALAHFPSTPALNVLESALVEQSSQRIDEIFYLLRAMRSPQAIDKIFLSLHSQDPLTRANALEALEVLTSPQIARLLGPLCDKQPDASTLLALASATWGQPAPDGEQAIRELEANSENRWISEIAATAGSPRISFQEDTMLSVIEKIIFLKEVPFFQGMTIEQLRVLANVCEEGFFPAETRLFSEGDPGGVLFMIVSGRVGIEQEKRKGSFARLATLEAHAYLGETDFFDNNCHTTSALAIQDTLTLRLRHEPVIALARQHPDLSLALIGVLSARLREANERIAELTRAHPEKINKLYDQLG